MSKGNNEIPKPPENKDLKPKSDGTTKSKIKRSRNGCHNCKRLKIKCDEMKPSCSYCIKTKVVCDYSIKLTWGGRPYKNIKKRNKDYSTPLLFNSNDMSSIENTKPKENKNKGAVQFVVENYVKADSSIAPSSSVNTDNDLTSVSLSSSSSLKRSIREAEIFDDKAPKSKAIHNTSHKCDSSTANSPSSFITPSGESILSNFNNYSLQDSNFSTLLAVSSIGSITDRSNNGTNKLRSPKMNMQSIDEHQSKSFFKVNNDNSFPLLKNFTEISGGMENLSNALEKVANGGQQFHLKNSEIFNNFVLSNFDQINSPISSTVDDATKSTHNIPDLSKPVDNHDPESQNNQLDTHTEKTLVKLEINDDSLSNYSEDLAKIESCFPAKQSPNFVTDFLSPANPFYSFFNSHNEKVVEVDEDDEVPLDSESDSSIKTPGLFTPDGKRISTPMEAFQSVPPPLSPLPEILLQVPFYRNLMHFWINVASNNLVPAPSHIYDDNPFKVILPQMAMEYPAILTTLLAFAATAKSSLIGDDPPKAIIDQLLARSCIELLKQLRDKKEATSDATLATVLLLSCYEVLNSNNFERHRAHTLGARQIIKARHSTLPILSNSDAESIKGSPDSSGSESSNHKPANAGTERDIAFFLMRWFVYVDVIGALSATKNAQHYLALSNEEGPYEPAESVTTLNDLETDLQQTPRDPKRDIDHLLGFDVRFLPQLTEIALLIRKTDVYLNTPGADKSSLPIEIITKALEIKEKITRAYEKGEARRQAKLDKIIDYKIQRKNQSKNNSPPNLNNLIEQDNILRSTNKIFCDMGVINLYRRVLQIPRESTVIQDLANGIGETLEKYIESKSSAEICSIFCLFCAGCETLNQDMRKLFHDRFSKLSQMGNINALKGLQIMVRCWQTGEDWIDASKKLDIDIALL